MENLYEDAGLYDLIYDENRNNYAKGMWEKFDLSQYGIKTIHDCSIGTGQLTISLAQLGFQVSGSDISDDMLEKCKQNAKEYGADINLTQSDFRFLTDKIEGQYDCVMSTGNSLAHVENADVIKTLHEMDKLVKNGGCLYFDLRNWDKIIKDHQRFYLYNPFFVNGERVNLIQVWDYNTDGTITFNLLYTFEVDNKIIRKKKSVVTYHPISRVLLKEELAKMGYTIQFEKPFPGGDISVEECDWYQILARK